MTWKHYLVSIRFTPSQVSEFHPPEIRIWRRTLVAMSERTGLSISQVTDEVLYTGLVEMQELEELEEYGGWEDTGPAH